MPSLNEELGAILSAEQKQAKMKERNSEDKVWWYTAVIPTLGSLRQEDYKFQACLGCLLVEGEIQCKNSRNFASDCDFGSFPGLAISSMMVSCGGSISSQPAAHHHKRKQPHSTAHPVIQL